METDRARQLAIQLMAENGLNHWDFAFNRRHRVLGLCCFTDQRIELSRPYVERHDEPEIRETLLHEIAHALAGPKAGHGIAWRAQCLRLGIPPRVRGEADMPSGRWQARCPGCAEQHARYRKPMRGRIYYCRRCGPDHGTLRFRDTQKLTTALQ
ncbi:MAG: SprT-like domain-containing protein [Phycisphaeraceae bacterium]